MRSGPLRTRLSVGDTPAIGTGRHDQQMVFMVAKGILNMAAVNDSPSDTPDRSILDASRNLTGSQIWAFREARGWSQSALAAELCKTGFKISRDIIASIEIQRSPVTDWQLAMFSKVFAVSFDSLFPDPARLEQVVANLAAAATEPQKTAKTKVPSQRPTSKSAGDWQICELSCKSLKVVLRRE